MRKFAIAVFMLFPSLLFAQTFWSVVNDDVWNNKSELTDCELFQDSLIVLAGKVSKASCPYSGLFTYNLKGKQKWKTDDFSDVVCTDSDFIYSAGHSEIDDVAGMEQVVVTKLNANGEEIFSIAYPEIPHEYFFESIPLSIDVSADGTILVASKNSVFKTDTSGVAIVETKLHFQSDVRNVLAVDTNSSIISTENTFYKTNESFLASDSIVFDNEIIKSLVVNDTLYGLFNNMVIRLNSSFEILDTLIFSADNKLRDIECFGELLYVESIYNDKISLVKIQNNSILDTLYFDLLCPITGFMVSGDEYIFCGNSPSNQMAIYGFKGESHSVTHELPDIEIVDFKIDSIQIDYVEYFGDSIAQGYFFDTEMTIKNNGMNLISSFAVFSDLHGGINCAQNYFYQKFTDVVILPNKTVTVQLNRIYEEGVHNNELCFECLAPNLMIETAIENNFLCKTFEVTGITNQPENSKIRFYPNPVTDKLNVVSDGTEVKSISLTDINGKNVYQKNTAEKNIIIDLNHLKSGTYIIKIRIGHEIISRIIIKE